MTKRAKPVKSANPDQVPAKVDLNAATVDQLQAIKGIGKSRALEIARHRD
jgi:DNA uptake protein ComE-like DNA-binding protein